MILKNLIKISSCLCLTISAVSAHQQPTKNFYVGTLIGVNNATARLDRLDLQNGSKTNTNISAYGLQAGLFLGFNHYVNENWYLGLETQANWHNIKANFVFNSNDPANADLHLKDSFNVAAQLGYRLQPNVRLYTKLGATTMNAFLTANEGTLNGRNQKRIYGAMIAIGLEIPIVNNLFVGTEFSHSRFQAIECTDKTFAQYKLRPQVNSLILKIGYQF